MPLGMLPEQVYDLVPLYQGHDHVNFLVPAASEPVQKSMVPLQVNLLLTLLPSNDRLSIYTYTEHPDFISKRSLELREVPPDELSY